MTQHAASDLSKSNDPLSHIEIFMFDMDGTLLDLAFDNHFWQELVPEAWASYYQQTLEQARNKLYPLFQSHEGSLNWYSLPFWSEQLGIDLTRLKQDHSALIKVRPNVIGTLQAIRASGRPVWLVTNAHPLALEIKLQESGLRPFFDIIVSSHDLHAPKESQLFWQRLQQQHTFNPSTSLLIDDSLRVLNAAQQYGLQVLAINQPDSRHPPKKDLPFKHITHLDELIYATPPHIL